MIVAHVKTVEPILRWDANDLYCGKLLMAHVESGNESGYIATKMAFEDNFHRKLKKLAENQTAPDEKTHDRKVWEQIVTEMLNELPFDFYGGSKYPMKFDFKWCFCTDLYCGQNFLGRLKRQSGGGCIWQQPAFEDNLREKAGDRWEPGEPLLLDNSNSICHLIENLYTEILHELCFSGFELNVISIDG